MAFSTSSVVSKIESRLGDMPHRHLNLLDIKSGFSRSTGVFFIVSDNSKREA
jgi:hypothetical protein